MGGASECECVCALAHIFYPSNPNPNPNPLQRKGSLSVVSDMLSCANPRSTSLYSMSNIGRLIRDRSQSSFSVSYKNMKKSPSLHSLDNVSIDSYQLEEQGLEDSDSCSLLDREGAGDDTSISGFKDTLSDQSGAESANEALSHDVAVSPDAVSATSQSTDDPARDLVSVLVLKLQSLCGALDMQGEGTTMSLELGQVLPVQVGNVSVRQYLSNRSLGAGPTVTPAARKSRPEVQLKLESGLSAATHSPLAAHNGFLQARLQDLSADFLTSSLRSLFRFLEDDDSTGQVLPMRISISTTQVNLQDDTPRDGVSDAESKPIVLHIDNLLIHRRDDGSFSIGGDQPSEAGLKSAVHVDSGSLCNLSAASRGTQTAPALTGEADVGSSSKEQLLKEENDCLKLELSRAKMALAEAQMEKDSLLHRMKALKLTTGGNS